MEATYLAEIRHPEGIEMRAGFQVVDCAQKLYEKHEEKIDLKLRIRESTWRAPGAEADACSIMQVSMLAMTCGTRVEVIASAAEGSGIEQGALEEAVKVLGEKLEKEDFRKCNYEYPRFTFTVVGYS